MSSETSGAGTQDLLTDGMDKFLEGLNRVVANYSSSDDDESSVRQGSSQSANRERVGGPDLTTRAGIHAKKSMPESEWREVPWTEITEIPFDWNVQDELRFLSRTSFSWVKQRRESEISKGLLAAMAPPQSPPASCVGSFDCRWKEVLSSGHAGDTVDVEEATAHYVHPAASLPGHILGFMKRQQLEKLRGKETSSCGESCNFLNARRNQWRDAFVSLFNMFKSGKCGSFFLRTTSFVAQFCRAESTHGRQRGAATPEEGSDVVQAILCPSPKKVRGQIRDLAIPFTQPLCAPESVEEDESQMALEREIKEHGFRMKPSSKSRAGKKGKRGLESTLHFSGSSAIHGLFDFLLNFGMQEFKRKYQLDFPTIIAPVPFLNCSAKMCSIVDTRKVTYPESRFDFPRRRDAASHRMGQAKDEELYSLTIKGPVLPPLLPKIILAVATRQGRRTHAERQGSASPGLDTVVLISANEKHSAHNCLRGELGAGQPPAKTGGRKSRAIPRRAERLSEVWISSPDQEGRLLAKWKMKVSSA